VGPQNRINALPGNQSAETLLKIFRGSIFFVDTTKKIEPQIFNQIVSGHWLPASALILFSLP
jgi:hypothetical protein